MRQWQITAVVFWVLEIIPRLAKLTSFQTTSFIMIWIKNVKIRSCIIFAYNSLSQWPPILCIFMGLKFCTKYQNSTHSPHATLNSVNSHRSKIIFSNCCYSKLEGVELNIPDTEACMANWWVAFIFFLLTDCLPSGWDPWVWLQAVDLQAYSCPGLGKVIRKAV